MSPHVPAGEPRHDNAGSSKPANAKLDALNKVVIVHIDVESPHVDNDLIVLFAIVDSSPSVKYTPIFLYEPRSMSDKLNRDLIY